ncbi:hypothetical protein [Gordonia lacunae]|uniref:Uncharacterized protein n=1 Tax=Gordonia lacunae TaxID=417102 RepID=A0A243Q5V7_9ACTN|nr:hypothetical protein [Gordonia lacunae]OUC75814.1 hypothetical protein CA982_24850 [Gordonia lacunae]
MFDFDIALSLDIDFDSMQYIDAAHRAAGSWTSQFDLSATVCLELTDSVGDIKEETKLLDIAGKVTFSADGKVQELVLSEVRAPDTDPMHRAWKQLRQRQHVQAISGDTSSEDPERTEE